MEHIVPESDDGKPNNPASHPTIKKSVKILIYKSVSLTGIICQAAKHPKFQCQGPTTSCWRYLHKWDLLYYLKFHIHKNNSRQTTFTKSILWNKELEICYKQTNLRIQPIHHHLYVTFHMYSSYHHILYLQGLINTNAVASGLEKILELELLIVSSSHEIHTEYYRNLFLKQITSAINPRLE